MDGALIILIAVVVIPAVIAAIIYGIAAERKRREAMAQLAGSLGLLFDAGSDPGHDERFGHFEVFCRGHSRRAFNTLSGNVTLEGSLFGCRCGDYEYKITTSNGKTTTTHTYRFSYLILGVPWQGVPDLVIRREGLWDKIKGFMGFDDIDFESEEFSRKFFVKSPDKRFAYAVVHPRMMEFLLASPGLGIDIERNECCMTDGRRRWDPQQFRDMLAWSGRFFALWPRHVLDDLSSRSGVNA